MPVVICCRQSHKNPHKPLLSVEQGPFAPHSKIMKPYLAISLVLFSSLATAAPEARQAALELHPQDNIARCGVGLIDRSGKQASIPLEQAMKAFPAPDKGMTRFIAQLPKLEEEQAFKVEIIVGKTSMVDTANRHFLGGKLEAETIKGWGYTRYILSKIGPMAGTLRARVGGQQKEERFVKIGSEPFLIRYNSRLPVVVYVPEGVEVKFRVWSAGQRTLEMEKG